jgi:hypothetical protein
MAQQLVEEFRIFGIKCDTEHCNYHDDEVKFEDYPKYINSKCPVCGSNLLTQQDYNKCLKMYKAVEIANKIHNVTKWFNPKHYYRLITGKKKETVTLRQSEIFPKKRKQ